MRRANLLLSWILLISLLWITNIKNLQAIPAAITGDSERLQAEMPSHCRELVKNGDFEKPRVEWDLLGSTHPPRYQGDMTNLKSKYALHLGSIDTASNVPSSSVTEQTIFLPDDAVYIILDFHYYPIFYDPKQGDGDDQFLEITNALTDQLIDRPFSILKNDRRWLFQQHDLTLFKGQQIRLRFGVNNDGADGRAAMYLDNVSVRVCYENPLDPTPSTTLISEPSPSLTPVTLTPVTLTPVTLTPTPTKEVIGLSPTPTLTPYPTLTPTRYQYPTAPPRQATPIPSGCNAPLRNPSFEEYDAYWHVGNDPIPPQPVSEERYSGAYSMLLGNPPHINHADLHSFSSIRQLVALPNNASTISLRWQALYRSEESYDSNPSARSDHQELVLLDTNLSTIAVPHRVRRNDGLWVTESIDLTPYRGRTLYIYFNVYNDGSGRRTWMYLDYVDLQVCYAAYVDPYPTALPIPATPVPSPTYHPTPSPTYPPTAPPTVTQAATSTATSTVTPAATNTPIPTATVPATSTTTVTTQPTGTATETATAIPTAASTATTTGTATVTPAVMSTVTPTVMIAVNEISTPRRPPLPQTPTKTITQIPISTLTPTITAVGVGQSTPSLLSTNTATSPTSVTYPVTTQTLVVNPTFTSGPLPTLSTRPAIPTPTRGSIFGRAWENIRSTTWMNRIGTLAVLISILAIIGLICWFLLYRFLKPQ